MNWTTWLAALTLLLLAWTAPAPAQTDPRRGQKCQWCESSLEDKEDWVHASGNRWKMFCDEVCYAKYRKDETHGQGGYLSYVCGGAVFLLLGVVAVAYVKTQRQGPTQAEKFRAELAHRPPRAKDPQQRFETGGQTGGGPPTDRPRTGRPGDLGTGRPGNRGPGRPPRGPKP